MAAWEEQVATAKATAVVDPAILEAAVEKVTDARIAVEQGELIRQAKAAHAKAKTHQQHADDYRKEAEKLRETARATADVLSKIVSELPDCELRVYGTEKGLRLVADGDRGKNTLYHEMSDGQRWKIAVTVGLSQLPENQGFLTIPQVAWSELQPATRRMIDQMAREIGAWVLTAEATDGELTAEAFYRTPDELEADALRQLNRIRKASGKKELVAV